MCPFLQPEPRAESSSGPSVPQARGRRPAAEVPRATLPHLSFYLLFTTCSRKDKALFETTKTLLVATAILLATLCPASSDGQTPRGLRASTDDAPRSSSASALAVSRTSLLETTYGQWRAQHEAQGGDHNVIIGLGYSKGLSTEPTEGRGLAALDLMNGEVFVSITGLEAPEKAEVWLVDNRPGPGASVAPQETDGLWKAGALQGGGSADRTSGELTARLPEGFLEDFEIDLVVITRRGATPLDGGLIFGTRSLFQRLYTQERLQRNVEGPGEKAASELLEPLIRQGAALFEDETFNGNSRTCATCHPADNNFTIDPRFIATLPANDPLFVAEFDPNLSNLERPQLMRQFGLILENVDGLEDPNVKFTMRSVPHTLAMRTSLTPTTADGSTIPPVERTGWSGDGSPNDGSLRQFAVGAVTQHFPKTLGRVAGVDFRLPTEEELDAMEAFQLVLGRDGEPDLSLVTLHDPTAALGQTIFLAPDTQGGTVSAGKCNNCHFNGGANFFLDGANRNFDTGVERDANPARLVESFPLDGGFGKTPGFLFDTDGDGIPDSGEIFGNTTFNTATVIEAADTPPFFHNNAIDTLEGAVAFYSGDAFNQSASGQLLAGLDSGGIGIQLTSAESDAVTAFLRVLNTAENIRASEDFLATARGASIADGRELIRLATADTIDGIEVLAEGHLHAEAELLLLAALIFEDAAGLFEIRFLRNLFLDAALDALDDARAELGTGF